MPLVQPCFLSSSLPLCECFFCFLKKSTFARKSALYCLKTLTQAAKHPQPQAATADTHRRVSYGEARAELQETRPELRQPGVAQGARPEPGGATPPAGPPGRRPSPAESRLARGPPRRRERLKKAPREYPTPPASPLGRGTAGGPPRTALLEKQAPAGLGRGRAAGPGRGRAAGPAASHRPPPSARGSGGTYRSLSRGARR